MTSVTIVRFGIARSCAICSGEIISSFTTMYVGIGNAIDGAIRETPGVFPSPYSVRFHSSHLENCPRRTARRTVPVCCCCIWPPSPVLPQCVPRYHRRRKPTGLRNHANNDLHHWFLLGSQKTANVKMESNYLHLEGWLALLAMLLLHALYRDVPHPPYEMVSLDH